MKALHEPPKEVFPSWLETGKSSYDIVPYTKSKEFYVCVSVHHNSILYKEPTRCNFGSVVY